MALGLIGWVSAAPAAGAGAPAARAVAAPPGSAPYGLLALTANGLPGSTVSERAANYRRLYAAGVRAVRLDFPWTEIQPHGYPPNKFDFSAMDREMQAIREAGLKVIGILDYGNPDYSTRGNYVSQTPLDGGLPPFGTGAASSYPPDNPADFARYARATVAHYAGEAVAWEVWNEENEGWRFWPPKEDPAAYARLLCATYPAVKAVDPTTPVLFGGVFFPAVADEPGTSGPDFVAQAYQADPQVGRCYDAMAYHPYPYPFTSPEVDVPVRGSVLSAADQMRAVLKANGDGGKPVWITEVGWPTSDRAYGVPESKQAQYVARMALATFSEDVPVLTFYTYGDYPDPSGADQEAWFGFFHIDNSPKPAYTALSVFASVFAGTHFVADRSRELGLPPGQQNTGGRGFALQYRGPGELVTAVWLANESAAEGQGQGPSGGSAAPATLPVSVPVAASSVEVIDYLGQRRTVAAVDGKVTLPAGAGPQYVVDRGPGAAAGGASAPGVPACARRRALRMRARVPHGSRLVRVKVYVNGRRWRAARARVRRGRLRVRVAARGLPSGRIRVRVAARLHQRGRTRAVVRRRTYSACPPRRRTRHRRTKRR